MDPKAIVCIYVDVNLYVNDSIKHSDYTSFVSMNSRKINKSKLSLNKLENYSFIFLIHDKKQYNVCKSFQMLCFFTTLPSGQLKVTSIPFSSQGWDQISTLHFFVLSPSMSSAS